MFRAVLALAAVLAPAAAAAAADHISVVARDIYGYRSTSATELQPSPPAASSRPYYDVFLACD